MFGVFRVKNHDFTPKNLIFSNCGGRRENVWGISCEKSRFYAKKIIFFPILGEGGTRDGCAPWICSLCRNHKPVLSSFMTDHRVSNTTVARVE
jgi:hypothetical protein